MIGVSYIIIQCTEHTYVCMCETKTSLWLHWLLNVKWKHGPNAALLSTLYCANDNVCAVHSSWVPLSLSVPMCRVVCGAASL